MPPQLRKLRYHVRDDSELGEEAATRPAESFRGPSFDADDVPPLTFNSDEAAARFYLDQLLERDERPPLWSVVEADRPERVPALVVESEQDLRATGTRQIRFAQTHRDIPIFGAKAVVELSETRDLVSANAQLDEVVDVDVVETLSRAEALERIAQFTGVAVPSEAGATGALNFYKDEDDVWHLAWFFQQVPAAPPEPEDDPDAPDDVGELGGHGLGRRPVPPRYNYLVDANDGQVLFFYSAVPTVLETPARCMGLDEEDTPRTFWGRLAAPGATTCQLSDPLRRLRTFDLQFADLDTDPPIPPRPVEAASNDWGASNRAAVSAHLNAGRVQDFFKSVLQRDGIDDKGMDLISLVNCTVSSMEQPPNLKNAFWWQGKMWYGQIPKDGRLVSLSRYLDVIAHELTHGVVEFTSNLVYKNQSGALNESFADIIGIVVKNWYLAADREDVATWDWELGSGLRGNGPLRNLADPTATGHPAHMDRFVKTTADSGGVHVNSNIHNKAAHHLLTMERGGTRVFTPADVAVLIYLGLARLTPLADFSDALQAVVDVAQTYFGGAADRKDKITAIREAYGLVGIA